MSGEIIAYLNSDDTYLPNAIRWQVEYLLQNPEVDVVYGDCQFIDQHGSHIKNGYGYPFRLLDLLQFNIPYQPTLFLTKQALLMGGPLDSSFHYSMDSEYWLRLHKLGFRFAYNPKFIATYRFHDSSKTVAGKEKMHKDWLELTKIYAPPEIYDIAMANLYVSIAIDLVEARHIRHSFYYARLALSTKWTRRIVLYFLVLVDHLTGLSFYEFALGFWVRIKRKA